MFWWHVSRKFYVFHIYGNIWHISKALPNFIMSLNAQTDDFQAHSFNFELQCCMVYWVIEAETYWPPFSRRHCQMNFPEWKGAISLNISLKFVPTVRIINILAIIQIMVWPTRRQAIIWSNDGLVYWRISASLGLNDLTVNLNRRVDEHPDNINDDAYVFISVILYATTSHIAAKLTRLSKQCTCLHIMYLCQYQIIVA